MGLARLALNGFIGLSLSGCIGLGGEGDPEQGVDPQTVVDSPAGATPAAPIPGPPNPQTGVPGNLAAPSELVAFTGGNSLAIRWSSSVPKDRIARFELFRDGSQIASISPTFHADFPQKDGYGFIDREVAPGRTYAYRVQVLDLDGVTSALSGAVTANHPVPGATTPPPTITVDSSRAPDLAQQMDAVVLPFLAIWYPKVADRIARPNFNAPVSFSIVLDPEYTGLAQTENAQLIRVQPNYLRANPNDLGMWIHEATHVIQEASEGTRIPGWAIEGIADWTREFILQDRAASFPIDGEFYESGYSTASYFLNWIQSHYSPDLIRKLMLANHVGNYSPLLFQSETGKGDFPDSARGSRRPAPQPKSAAGEDCRR